MANKMILGEVVGHYGVDQHLNLDLPLMTSTAWKYIVKHLGFVRFYAHGTRDLVFGFFDQTWVVYGTWILTAIGLSIGLFFREKFTNRGKLIIFFSFAFLLALAPVLNLFFYKIQYLENDRYGYFPTVFLALTLVFVFGAYESKRNLLAKYLGYAIIAGYTITSLYLLLRMNNYWKQSCIVEKRLMDNYRWQSEDEVYILNLPENYKGFYLFRDHSGNHAGFQSALEHIVGKKIKGHVTEVIQYNINAGSDGAKVSRDSSGVIKLELNQWGSWWWRNNLIGTKYETDDYSVQLKDKKYTLTPKRDLSKEVMIYYDGSDWVEL